MCSTTLRRLLLALAHRAGLLAAWRWWHRRSVVILSLHGVMDDADGATWRPLRERVSRATLRRFVAALRRRYTLVGLDEAVDMLAGRKPPRPYCMAITFDDGYRNNITHALPVLAEAGVPMTVFLTSGKLDRRTPFVFDRIDYALQRLRDERIVVRLGRGRRAVIERSRAALVASFSALRSTWKRELGHDMESSRELLRVARELEARAGASLEASKERDDWTALLRWDEARALAEEGSVDFGSHTVDHARLGLADDATIRAQLRESKRRIERATGRPCAHLAYPNGSFDARVGAIARDEGYASGFTTEEGLNRPGDDLYALKRVGLPVDASDAELLAQASGLSAAISRAVRFLRRCLHPPAPPARGRDRTAARRPRAGAAAPRGAP